MAAAGHRVHGFHLQAGDAQVTAGGGGLNGGPRATKSPDGSCYDPDAPVAYWLDRSLWDLAAAAR